MRPTKNKWSRNKDNSKMDKTSVLFLCTHNSARSQMAEGLLRHFYGDKYEVFSAGADPTRVNPLAVKAVAEIGIDISKQRSKSIEEFRDKEIDLAVTVCSGDSKVTCPFCASPLVEGRPEIINETLPRAKRYLQHGFPDPAEAEGSDEEKLAVFRHVRDEMRKWIADYFVDPKKAVT